MKQWQVILAGLTLAAVAVVSSTLWFGSLNRAAAALTGRPICIEPQSAVVKLNDHGIGEQELTMTNVSARTITILGAQLPCTCMTASELPIEILSGKSALVRVRLTKPTKLKEYRLNFLTDCPDVSAVCVVLSGS